MHPVQRVEIIADEVEMHKLANCFDKVGVSNYIVMRNVLHKSAKGSISDDLAMTGLGNVYVIFYCPPDQVKAIMAEVRPILNKFGGACYISEATEIRSVKCVAAL